MSDAGDSGFDEEAERERLREKYEREQEERAAAQQMSDLLLKGATMTNSHCGTCGSPIFRQDGREFCPNCSAEATEAAEGDDPTPDEQLADAGSGDEGADDSEPAPPGGTSIEERAVASVQSGERRDPPGQSDDEFPTGDPDRQQSAPEPTPPTAGDASLADAQQSLLNAIAHHARAAIEADPRTARDHLEAASEAAEALAEISQ